jgi:LPS-assembly protein
MKAGKTLLLTLVLCTISLFLTFRTCTAREQFVITSDSVEYDPQTSTYTAKGNAKIEGKGAAIQADEIRFNEAASKVDARGNVSYVDEISTMTATRALIDTGNETGVLENGEVLIKEGNYRITGESIEKRGKDIFFSPDAGFTTCEGDCPDWSFRGRNVHVRPGGLLTASGATFRLKDTPVLYTPYFAAPVIIERKTGFLLPDVGYSDDRGMNLRTPFYLVLAENMDMTLVPDFYSKRGTGKGLEYRYVFPEHTEGKWWLYHLRDRKLEKDFLEIRALHDQRHYQRPGGFINVNYVNETDFFREFNTDIQVRSNRFLESAGAFSLPFRNSRAYLLSQYWVDLKEDSDDPVQRLPEIGYVLNSVRTGPVWVEAESSFSNFWRNHGTGGQRLDFYPRVTHTFGEDFIVLQRAGLRETLYSEDESREDEFIQRTAFEYSASGHVRYYRRFGRFVHIIEPTVGYTLVSVDEESNPVFDSVDLIENTSVAEVVMLNRFIGSGGEFLVVRVAQGFDFHEGDRSFLPLSLQAAVKRPLFMRVDSSFNVHSGEVETVNSDIGFSAWNINVSAGQRYNRQEDNNTIVAGLGLYPFRPVYLDGRIWYDAEEKEVRDISVGVKYISQCWGIGVNFTKRPGDFSVHFLIELKGITRPIQI